MSEEGIAYDVESGPGPAGEPAPEPVAETPAPAPEAEAAPAEPEAVEVGGERMVPLAALISERRAAATLKTKADQFDQMAGWYNEAKPYVDFLKNNPDLLKPREAPAPVAAPPPPEADPALVSLARTLDLYTPEGQPDAKRAQAIREMVKTEAQGIAREAVQPFEQQSIQQRAQTNLRDAMAVEFNGIKPNQDVLQHIWKTTDPKVLATQQGAAAAVLMALGMGAASPQSPVAAPVVAPPSTTPILSEPTRATNRPALSEFEAKVYKLRGIDHAKAAEHLRGFRPGETNALEND